MLATALVVLWALAGAPAASDAAVARVRTGDARAVVAGELVALTPRGGARELAGAAWLECGPRSTLELAWRGRASASIEGPAALALGPGAALALERYEVVELEVRRGGLALELAGHGRVELARGVVRLRALAGGGHELWNRGGAPLSLGAATVAPGERVRLAARAR